MKRLGYPASRYVRRTGTCFRPYKTNVTIYCDVEWYGGVEELHELNNR